MLTIMVNNLNKLSSVPHKYCFSTGGVEQFAEGTLSVTSERPDVGTAVPNTDKRIPYFP